jgi:para-nitrobenzyl esterase
MLLKRRSTTIEEGDMAVQVRTRQGMVEGEQRVGHATFRGIPFAKPPVGPLRFRAPEPPDAWSGTRAALSHGPSAMQAGSAVPGMAASGPLSEDCLYLNVDTPAADTGRRPVLFWIHGGAFTLGSSSSPVYDGGPLAERGDAVVVTINYRLGAFGYLSLAEHGGDRLGASANLGQLDQIAALRWVRDNIEAFGGDPGNVTIFGESAGSFAVCMLLMMPEARGLFHRAVAQSGAALTLTDTAGAAKITSALMAGLGIAENDVEALWKAPAEAIIAAQESAGREVGGRGFFPVLDGKTLPLQPADAITAGKSAEVPLVIGTNRDELNLFLMPLLRTLDKPMTDEQACALLARELPRSAADRVPGLLATYRESRAMRGLPHGNRALLGAIQGDYRFRISSIRFAEAYRTRQPSTFMYLFCYESPAMRGALRACHALEIPFVFGTLTAPFQDRFAGKGPEVERLSERMMDTWLALARRGSPSLPQADWIPYDPQRRATMVFDRDSRLEDAPYEQERAAWDGIA